MVLEAHADLNQLDFTSAILFKCTWLWPEPMAQVHYRYYALPVLPLTMYILKIFCRTVRWIFIKFDTEEVIMAPYACRCFSVRSAWGWSRAGNSRSWRDQSLQSRSPDVKAKATNRGHSSDVESCGKYLFLVQGKSKICNPFLYVIFTFRLIAVQFRTILC